MACVLEGGAIDMSAEVDENAARTYKVTWQVRSTTGLDGPANVLQTPGIPIPGTMWNYLSDVDVWAWCRPECSVRRHRNDNSQDPIFLWEVEQTFSTKRPSREQAERQRPPDQQPQDPIGQPPRVSGRSFGQSEEIAFDRNGNRILTSAREPIRGPSVTFDYTRDQVVIEMDVAALQLSLCRSMVNTVNDATLWGSSRRFIRLSEFSWSYQYYGSAFLYYTRRFVFDIYGRYDPTRISLANPTGYVSGWDRRIPDEGTLVLRGQWERNPNLATYGTYRIPAGLTIETAGPGDIIAFQDFHGNPTTVLLDGHGRPWDALGQTTGTTGDDDQGFIDIEHYQESNFLLLGIPATI